MSTITRELLPDVPAAGSLAATETTTGFNALGIYAWIVVSVAILVTAAVLGQVEDAQAVRADDASTPSVTVARN